MVAGARAAAASAAAPAPVPETPAGGLDAEPRPALEVETFPGESQLTEDERNRWLVLHFALPRTVVTCDLVEGRSTEAELNDALSTMAWGSVDDSTRQWVLRSEDVSLERPDSSLISYAEFVDRAFPVDQTTDETARNENAGTAALKRTTFTRPQEPGARLRPWFDQMVKGLTHSNKALAKAFDLKKAILVEDDMPEDLSRSEAQNIMRYGRHQILPSFWQLLVCLTKKNRRFSVVFRSFSRKQLSSVQRELRLFCQGEHPAYNGLNKTQKPPPMSGEKGSRDMRLTDAAIGSLDRMNGGLEFIERVVPEADLGDDDDAAAADPLVRPVTYNFPPFHEVYAGLMNHVLDRANTAAIIDDLAYWESKSRDATAGKLLLVDHAGGLAETKVQHIFFDGHIRETDAHCVDVRDVVSGEPLLLSQAEGLFLHRVDFCQAIADVDYFVKALEACELNMSQTIVETRRVECAREEDAVSAASLPPKEYLYRNVIPALLPALEACQRDRPADPLEFIAFYMLRHSKQYSKTLKG